MKNLVIISILVITSSIFAQEKIDVNSTNPNKQADDLMTKIAADPDLRIKMINMMIEQTSGNADEMMKLVNAMYLDPDMQKMMSAKSEKSTDDNNFSIDARGSMKEPAKEGKKDFGEPIGKKKNKFPK